MYVTAPVWWSIKNGAQGVKNAWQIPGDEGLGCVLAWDWQGHLHFSKQTDLRCTYMFKAVIAFCRSYAWSFSWPWALQVVSQGTWCATTTASFMPWCRRSKYQFFSCSSNLQNLSVSHLILISCIIWYNCKPNNLALELYCCKCLKSSKAMWIFNH